MAVQKMRNVKRINAIINRPEYKSLRYTYCANVSSYSINNDLLDTLVPGRQPQYSITKINKLYKKFEGLGYNSGYFVYDNNDIYVMFSRFTNDFHIGCI